MNSRSLNTIAKVASIVAVMAFSGQTFAVNGTLYSTIKRVLLTTDSTFGGCMIQTDADPKLVVSLCGAGYVSLGCSGEFTDSVRAYRMLDQAQLAFATNNRIYISFTNDKMYNGYCVATRMDLVE